MGKLSSVASTAAGSGLSAGVGTDVATGVMKPRVPVKFRSSTKNPVAGPTTTSPTNTPAAASTVDGVRGTAEGYQLRSLLVRGFAPYGYGSRVHRLLRFGVEAPYFPVGLGAGTALLMVLARVLSRWLALPAVFIGAATVIYLHTTLRGKHVVWRRELDRLGLNGNERLLDVGCGTGTVLVAAAQRLPCGRADGIDLWRSVDQSGNEPARTMANAHDLGVAERIRLHTGDMTNLPFSDGSFDVVTSALAVHNIPTTQGRRKAVTEMARVLKPGGKLVLIDIRHAQDYATALSDTMANLTRRRLGINYWYGWPWTSATAVTGVRKSPVARSWRHHHLAVRAAGEGQFPA